MSPRAFEPGWEIGIRNSDTARVHVGTVQRITFNGHIIVEDSVGIEHEFDYTGIAIDAEQGYPCLVQLTREWRQARRMQMKLRRLKEINWYDFEDSVVSEVYALLDHRHAFEWRDDTEDDYSADVKIIEANDT